MQTSVISVIIVIESLIQGGQYNTNECKFHNSEYPEADYLSLT